MTQKKKGRPAKTERSQEMARLFAEGMTHNQLAKRYGITTSRVSRILGPTKKKETDAKMEAAWRLVQRDTGISLAAVAKTVGLTRQTLLARGMSRAAINQMLREGEQLKLPAKPKRQTKPKPRPRRKTVKVVHIEPVVAPMSLTSRILNALRINA